MKFYKFHFMDEISKIGFLNTNKTACDNNEIREKITMRLFLHWMKNSVAASSTAFLPRKTKSSHYRVNEELLATYCQAAKPFLGKYSISDSIAEIDWEQARHLRPSSMSPVDFFDGLWLDPKMPKDSSEYVLKVVLHKELLWAFRNRIDSYWISHKTALLQKWAHED